MDYNRNNYKQALDNYPVTTSKLTVKRIDFAVELSLLIVGISSPHHLFAAPVSENAVPSSKVSHVEEIEEENDIISWIDDTQLTIADSIHDYSSSFDHFVGKKDDEEPMNNRSYLRLKLKSRYSHRENFDPDGSVYFKLDLPHTKKNWKLIFESDPDDFDRLEDKERGISANSSNSLSGAVGGVRLQGRKWGEWKTNFDLGLKLRFPIDPFTRIEVYRTDQLSYEWTSLTKQEVFYYKSKGPGAITSFNFYHAISQAPSTILKLSLNAQYLDTDNNWEVVQQAEIFDRVNQDNLLQYSIGVSADSRPNYSVTNSWVSIGWKHRLYKKWLYLTATSEFDFQEQFNYKINPGIMLELELYFSSNARSTDRLKRSIPSL
ncbi:hypothetical protein C942_00745 [Photobacterium marinum]|uniref:Uncharacterized protein n=2 Tax=Photobacterium marinum TaxID=1056511 RepID=L8JE29_9GAMM|nr:hypothetical protein C942_00745 [Photobacterium marinum]